MKKTFKSLKFSAVFLLFLASFIACDKDFSVIESDVLGIDNANFTTGIDTLPIVAYNKKLEAVQINNLPSNFLGFYDDPDYGKTTASIVTQLTPTAFSEEFGTDPIIDSVVINIPYFSTAIALDVNGNTTYQLDSVYGNPAAKFKLTVYQNNYFLSNSSPELSTNGAQNYYSNAASGKNSAFNGFSTIDFDDHIGEMIIDTTFSPTSNATVLKTGEGENLIETRSIPAFRYSINSNSSNGPEQLAFWKATIIDNEDDLVLSNPNQFRNFFRGLYFKTEAIENDGNMVLMNLGSTEANVTIYYSKVEDTARTQDSYVLNFSGNRLNTFINDFDKVTLEDGDKDNGDENLYIKGLEGSMAVVDLFGNEDTNNNNIPDALEDFKDQFLDSEGKQKKLINEAHLLITDIYGSNDFHKYDRIYAYDVKNNITTIDYQLDPVESNEALTSKTFSLGQRDDETGKYKIRLTEHLNNIIQNDSTNYQIGLVLSNNVNFTSISEILNSNDNVTGVPTASIMSPRGTILHGNNTILDDKKLILKVFFTESK